MAEKLVSSFVSHLAQEAGVAPHVVGACRTDVRQFISYVECHGLAIERIGAADLLGFLAEQKNRGASPEILERKVSSLGGFYRHLMRRRICNRNPVIEVQLEPAPPRQIHARAFSVGPNAPRLV